MLITFLGCSKTLQRAKPPRFFTTNARRMAFLLKVIYQVPYYESKTKARGLMSPIFLRVRCDLWKQIRFLMAVLLRVRVRMLLIGCRTPERARHNYSHAFYRRSQSPSILLRATELTRNKPYFLSCLFHLLPAFCFFAEFSSFEDNFFVFSSFFYRRARKRAKTIRELLTLRSAFSAH